MLFSARCREHNESYRFCKASSGCGDAERLPCIRSLTTHHTSWRGRVFMLAAYPAKANPDTCAVTDTVRAGYFAGGLAFRGGRRVGLKGVHTYSVGRRYKSVYSKVDCPVHVV